MPNLQAAEFPVDTPVVWGATAAHWSHFSNTLGLTADLLPVVARPDAPISENSKLREPGKTPSLKNRDGKVVGIPEWTQHEASAAQIKRWATDPDLGICVITRHLRAIDVDIVDEHQATAIRNAIEAYLVVEGLCDELALRTRGNSPKFLIPFWLEGTFPKRVIRTANGIIEFLGNGQQFVAMSTHPSGARYEWVGTVEVMDDVALPSGDAIPTLSSAQFEGLWAHLQAEFGIAPSQEMRSAGAQPTRPRSLADANDALLEYLERKGWVVDYQADGRVNVRCPWEDGHSVDSGPTSTTFFPAGVGGFQQGHFKCLHATCAQRTDGDFIEAIGWVTQSFNVIMSPSEYAAALAAGEIDEGPDGLPVLAADGATIDVIDGLDDPEQVAVRARNAVKADTAEVAARSVADIVDELRRLPRDQVLAEWVGMSVALPKDATAEVVEQVSRLTGVGVRRLNAALADARTRRARSAHESGLARRIGDRLRLEWRPEDKTKLADKVEASILRRAAPDEYLQFGGVPARVVVKTMPGTQHIDDPDAVAPPVAHIEPLDQVGALALAERSVAFVELRGDTQHLIGIPQAMIDILLLKKSHLAPAVSGLLVHPVVLRDGTILAEDGLHEPSGLFLKGAACPGARPYTQAEAVEALARIRAALLDGFEFDIPLSADAALAGLFTGVQRRVLDQAPGLAVLAGAQASGKTTLARRLHLLLTGQDMPVASFPAGDEAEIQKRLLSLLLRSPAMVCFDNLADGTTFRSAALAAAMTGPVLSQRVLGVSRDADAPTNVLFVLTGNNLSLGADEATRWMVSRLAPTAARPEERQFQHTDVVAHALKVRQAVLADVVGIVAGFLAYGTPQRPRTRFAQWDRMVRQPLLWAGASDLAEVFAANSVLSEDLRSHTGLLQLLWELFGEAEFGARDVAALAAGSWGVFDPADENDTSLAARVNRRRAPQQVEEMAVDLRSLLESLRAKDAGSERSVGRVLQACVGRVASVETDEGLMPMAISSRPNRRAVMRYRLRAKNDVQALPAL